MTLNADISRRDLMAAGATLLAAVPARNLLADVQAAPLPKGDTIPKIVRGAVFESRSGAQARQAGDPGIGGVLVSNGREVVRTGRDGRYSLPIEYGTEVSPGTPTRRDITISAQPTVLWRPRRIIIMR